MRGAPRARPPERCGAFGVPASDGVGEPEGRSTSDLAGGTAHVYVNTFIDTIGKDISATIAPQIETLAQQITTRTFTQYGPRVSAFAGELVKDIIEEQSATVRDAER